MQAQQDGFQASLPQTLIYRLANPPRVLARLLHNVVLGAGACEPELLPAGHRSQDLAGDMLSMPSSHSASSSRKKLPCQGKGCWDFL